MAFKCQGQKARSNDEVNAIKDSRCIISCERQAFQKVVRQEEAEAKAEAEPAAGTAGEDVCPRVDTIEDCEQRSLLNITGLQFKQLTLH